MATLGLVFKFPLTPADLSQSETHELEDDVAAIFESEEE